MTEIPEHLLKRSRERRAAVTGSGDDAAGESGDSASESTAVAATASSAPTAAAPSGPPERAAAAAAPAAPEPPKPDIPVVAAYKARRKIPFWAMTAMALLPVWAFMYARAVTTQAEEAAGPLGEGTLVYGNCASCHGAGGGGGLGYAFTDGEVIKTFPNIEDQLRFVYWGTDNYALANIDIYGDPDREGGAHQTGGSGAAMPAQGAEAGGALEDFEILGVVCHERYTLGGADEMVEYDGEFEKWCSEESPLYQALEGGETLAALAEVDDTIIPIGAEPAPAAPRADSAAAGQPEQG